MKPGVRSVDKGSSGVGGDRGDTDGIRPMFTYTGLTR